MKTGKNLFSYLYFHYWLSEAVYCFLPQLILDGLNRMGWLRDIIYEVS